MKTIAQNNWLRPIFGGIVTGGVNYGLFHSYPEIALIAVPIAVLVGAFWCIAPERIVLAVFQAVIAGVILFLAHRMTPKIMANVPQWWKVAPASLILGTLGGAAVGALLGGVCRLFWKPITHAGNDASNRN